MKADKSIPIHLLPGGHFRATTVSTAFGEHSPSHRINFYAIVWFTEDAGEHFIDFESHPIAKATVYFIGKGQVHSIPSERLPQARTMVFSEECFHRIEEPFLRQLFLPFDNRGIKISDELLKPVTDLFDLIVMESSGQADINLLIKLVTAWLTLLHRQATDSVFIDVGADQRITKILQLIQTDFREQRSAAYYADQVGLTPKRVNEILREKAGFTINQLLSQLLLVEAKRQLYHGELSVKEIAYQLGFSDQSYFARFFKKQTGVSPERFKADHF